MTRVTGKPPGTVAEQKLCYLAMNFGGHFKEWIEKSGETRCPGLRKQAGDKYMQSELWVA